MWDYFTVLRTGISGLSVIRYAILLAVAALGGCSLIAPDSAPEEGAVVVIPAEPPQTAVAPPPVAPPPKLPPVAVVISGSQPAFLDVANALTEYLDDFRVFDLSDTSQPPVSVLRVINDSSPGAVVAIGLRAAQSSVAMSEAPVIFSQVFNYNDHDLLTANSRGVAPLAPLDAQLAAWIESDPTISRIGIIVGEGHDDLIDEAKLAAEAHDIDLRIQVTHSDQETLYFFRRMIRDIDGFWLFPDNRVLSGRVLQQMLTEANQQQVPVTVPSESMLQMGATISMSTVAADIAETIIAVMQRIRAGELNLIPPITQLSEIRVVTNEAVQVVER